TAFARPVSAVECIPAQHVHAGAIWGARAIPEKGYLLLSGMARARGVRRLSCIKQAVDASAPSGRPGVYSAAGSKLFGARRLDALQRECYTSLSATAG